MIDGKEYVVWFDVDVSFDMDHGNVSLSFGDRQADIEGEYEALDERDAIEQAHNQYIDNMIRYAGKDFVDCLTIEFSNSVAEELDDLEEMLNES